MKLSEGRNHQPSLASNVSIDASLAPNAYIDSDGVKPAIVFNKLNYYVNKYSFHPPWEMQKFHEKQEKLKRQGSNKFPKYENMDVYSKTTQILYDVTGYIPQKCLCGIIGSSGAGKTTFLGIIAGIPKVGKVTGNIAVCSKQISFVSQYPALPETETVYELLHFACRVSFASKTQSELKAIENKDKHDTPLIRSKQSLARLDLEHSASDHHPTLNTLNSDDIHAAAINGNNNKHNDDNNNNNNVITNENKVNPIGHSGKQSKDLLNGEFSMKRLMRYRISKVLETLNLFKIKDSRIKHLSGGERKRLSIAVQLITNPDILILDEPTSGLDTPNALSLVQQLKYIVIKHECTVIMSIHQPQRRICECIDWLLSFKDGFLLYQGMTSDAIRIRNKLLNDIRINVKHLAKKQKRRITVFRNKRRVPLLNVIQQHHSNDSPYASDNEDESQVALKNATNSNTNITNIAKSNEGNNNNTNVNDKTNTNDDNTGNGTNNGVELMTITTLNDEKKSIINNNNDNNNNMNDDGTDDLSPISIDDDGVRDDFDIFDYLDERLVSRLSDMYSASLNMFVDPILTNTRATVAQDRLVKELNYETLNVIITDVMNKGAIAANPADYLLETEYLSKTDKLYQHWLDYSESKYGDFYTLINDYMSDCILLKNGACTKYCDECTINSNTFWNSTYAFGGLFMRSMRYYWRMIWFVILNFVISVVAALVLYSIYGTFSEKQSDIQNRFGALSFACIFTGIQAIAGSTVFAESKAVFIDERNSGLYGSIPHLFGRALPDLILIRIIPSFFFGWILFDLTGLQDHTFGEFILTIMLLATSTSVFVFSMSALWGSQYLSNFVCIFGTLLFILYSGIFVQNNTETEVEIMQYPKYLSFYKYAFEILMCNELIGLRFRISNTTVSVNGLQIDSSDFEVYIGGDYFATNFWGFDPDNIDNDFIAMGCLIIGYLLLAWVGLEFLHKAKA